MEKSKKERKTSCGFLYARSPLSLPKKTLGVKRTFLMEEEGSQRGRKASNIGPLFGAGLFG